MAKGIRSKVTRRNRTLLRETISKPIAERRQLELAQELKRSLAEKKGGTIVGLKNLLSKGNNEESKTIDNLNDINFTSEPDVIPGAYNVTKKKKGISISQKLSLKKGKSPKKNPGKELVWFK